LKSIDAFPHKHIKKYLFPKEMRIEPTLNSLGNEFHIYVGKITISSYVKCDTTLPIWERIY
jgi:hypothetical protein